MALLLTGLTSLFGGGAAAAGTAATVAVPGIAGAATLVPAGAAAAGGGFSLASILQGTATVLGLVSSVAAGAAEGDQMEAAAIDAQREESLETLQGIERRGSIKRAMADALGAQDVAYGASGVDLSFGTAAQARGDAFREADLALSTASGTEMTRVSRLSERAANYRRGAKRARIGGWVSGLGGALSSAASIAGRY